MSDGYYHDLSTLKAQVIQPCRALTFHLFNLLPYYGHRGVIIAFLTSPEGVDVVMSDSWIVEEMLSQIITDYWAVKYDYFALRDKLKENLKFEKVEEMAKRYGLELHLCYDGYELAHILIEPQGEVK